MCVYMLFFHNHIYIYIYIERERERDEKLLGIQRMISFVEIFANIKRFSFQTLIWACKMLNEMKKMRKYYNIIFQICVILLAL